MEDVLTQIDISPGMIVYRANTKDMQIDAFYIMAYQDLEKEGYYRGVNIRDRVVHALKRDGITPDLLEAHRNLQTAMTKRLSDTVFEIGGLVVEYKKTKTPLPT